ncbi:hypothetical protein BN1049_02480 [Pseudomonas saudimassiliensis]|uniref:Uncharacterized protein n=1 Tax=Pseudomonas saudimassiliensis TaxID=1461581 RepID=A0A078MFL7_9PSED|nr:hypothetical protein BN1049_02480 [Pseudomonas saudimassiliensis]CEF27528.1 hypothetical protein BN1049_02480 [Pseudomonas saudimassiliensis]
MWLPCAGSSLEVEKRINQPRSQAKHSLFDTAEWMDPELIWIRAILQEVT